ncbi:MAG: sigma-54-dependent Fis family transcriptional regulator [Gammaproteobacteria bacterium]|nr:sigma-54-dependent Fis family transcriptional regulator [Gammaproteobacteria bacterium]
MEPAKVLIVEDDPALQEALVTTLEGAGYDVLSTDDGARALDIAKRTPLNLVVTDVQMSPMDGNELLTHMIRDLPDVPVLMMTAYGTISQAVSAMQKGAVDYLEKPFEASELEAIVARHARIEPESAGSEPIAADPRSRALLQTALKVSQSDVAVLLRGESGTGKEVLARYLHVHSARSDGPFVAINCAAIPDQMLEAILFGHEKGAFTGADGRREGKFVQASGGTLLLDEISEMDLGLQAKLLRVLQEKEVEPLGAKAAVQLDTRVIATTNRDLEEAVRSNAFREDLYYRLNVFPLTIPPLRERPGDILPLVEDMLRAECRPGIPPEISAAARDALERAEWPGNVRQLRNSVQRALVLWQGGPLEAEHFGITVASDVPPARSGGLGDELWHEEAKRIVAMLERERGNRKATAAQLGISPRTLRYKLAKMRDAGVDIPAFSRADSLR